MRMAISKDELYAYLVKQLDFYIPDGYTVEEQMLKKSIDIALDRCEECFSHILVPGYRQEKEAVFSHLHMDQYASFLYFVANTIWTRYEERWICDKLLNLNRILNGFFISYKCNMPEHFIFAHPVGSVIGNAVYSDGLYISQNVTINTHKDEVSGECDLIIGRGCFLGPGSQIIGRGVIGDRVSIGAGVTIYNQDVDDDNVCVKDEQNRIVIRKCNKEKSMAERYFDICFR